MLVSVILSCLRAPTRSFGVQGSWHYCLACLRCGPTEVRLVRSTRHRPQRDPHQQDTTNAALVIDRSSHLKKRERRRRNRKRKYIRDTRRTRPPAMPLPQYSRWEPGSGTSKCKTSSISSGHRGKLPWAQSTCWPQRDRIPERRTQTWATRSPWLC